MDHVITLGDVATFVAAVFVGGVIVLVLIVWLANKATPSDGSWWR